MACRPPAPRRRAEGGGNFLQISPRLLKTTILASLLSTGMMGAYYAVDSSPVADFPQGHRTQAAGAHQRLPAVLAIRSFVIGYLPTRLPSGTSSDGAIASCCSPPGAGSGIPIPTS